MRRSTLASASCADCRHVQEIALERASCAMNRVKRFVTTLSRISVLQMWFAVVLVTQWARWTASDVAQGLLQTATACVSGLWPVVRSAMEEMSAAESQSCPGSISESTIPSALYARLET